MNTSKKFRRTKQHVRRDKEDLEDKFCKIDKTCRGGHVVRPLSYSEGHVVRQ